MQSRSIEISKVESGHKLLWDSQQLLNGEALKVFWWFCIKHVLVPPINIA